MLVFLLFLLPLPLRKTEPEPEARADRRRQETLVTVFGIHGAIWRGVWALEAAACEKGLCQPVKLPSALFNPP